MNAVCSYSYSDQELSLYLDGAVVASSTVAVTSFLHGPDMPLGVGNRPSSQAGNPGHSAGSDHFVGDVDDFVLWDRPLSAEEVALLHASGVAAEDQGGSGVSDSPTSSPTKTPTDQPTAKVSFEI